MLRTSPVRSFVGSGSRPLISRKVLVWFSIAVIRSRSRICWALLRSFAFWGLRVESRLACAEKTGSNAPNSNRTRACSARTESLSNRASRLWVSAISRACWSERADSTGAAASPAACRGANAEKIRPVRRQRRRMDSGADRDQNRKSRLIESRRDWRRSWPQSWRPAWILARTVMPGRRRRSGFCTRTAAS